VRDGCTQYNLTLTDPTTFDHVEHASSSVSSPCLHFRVAAVLYCVQSQSLVLGTVSIALICSLASLARVASDARIISALELEKTVQSRVNAERLSLLGVMSHEVKNRLDALNQLLVAPEEMDAEIVCGLGLAMQQSVSVVLDLLDLESRSDMEEPLENIQLAHLINSAQKLQLTTLATTDANTSAPFRIHIDSAINTFIRGHKKRLHWILCHLLANAFEGCGFSEDASVEVHVKLSTESPPRCIAEVQNRGATHRQEDLDDALASHKQGPSTLRRRWGGCGLGLRHVKTMLKVLDSPLELHSIPPNIVQARFSFPYAPIRDESSWSPEAHPTLVVKDEIHHVLHVEDERIIRMLTSKGLTSALGCSVVAAVNGVEGIQAFRKDRFDLVLMDIQMPKLCGDEATKKMRLIEAQQGWPRTLILARTGNTSQADMKRYKKCGLDGCISKMGNVVEQVCCAVLAYKMDPTEFVVVSTKVAGC